MDKKNELAKEEKTIFIVLAIIVLIAIGVLVTWYFTKDKNDDKKPSTKTETVDKQKKKKTEKAKTYERTTTETTKTTSSKVAVVSETGKTEPEAEEIVNYENTVYFYIVGENINFGSFKYSKYNRQTSAWEDVQIQNASIKSVDYYDEESGNWVSADGKYLINNGNVIKFNHNGDYRIIVVNSDGSEHKVYVTICDVAEVNQYVDNIETSGIDYLTGFVDANKIDELRALINDYRNTSDSNPSAKRRAYNKVDELYNELANLAYEQRNSDVAYNEDHYIYFVDEKIEFGNYRWTNNSGDELSGVISSIEDENGDPADGKYTSLSDTKVSFNTVGEYDITLRSEAGEEEDVYIYIVDNDELNDELNYLEGEIEDIRNDSTAIYSQSLLEQVSAILRNRNSAINSTHDAAREYFSNLVNKYSEFNFDGYNRNTLVQSLLDDIDDSVGDTSVYNAAEIAKINDFKQAIKDIAVSSNNLAYSDFQANLVSVSSSEYNDALARPQVYAQLIDKISDVDTKITNGTYNQANYTTDSWASLTTALNDAKAITNDDNLTDTTTAKNNLETAEDGLVTVAELESAKSTLTSYIAQVQTDYPNDNMNTSKFSALTSAISTAQTNMDSFTTLEQVNNAKTDIENKASVYYQTMLATFNDIVATIRSNYDFDTLPDNVKNTLNEIEALTTDPTPVQIMNYYSVLADYVA